MNDEDIAALTGLRLAELRHAWRTRLGSEAPPFRSRDLLLRALIYQLEAATFGDVKPSLKRRLTELSEKFASDPDYDPALRTIPSPGAALVRDWNGVRHVVLVTNDGFQYLDKTYASLTQVARKITGTHQSGPAFFGLSGSRIAERTFP